jgi:hypothetical protein
MSKEQAMVQAIKEFAVRISSCSGQVTWLYDKLAEALRDHRSVKEHAVVEENQQEAKRLQQEFSRSLEEWETKLNILKQDEASKYQTATKEVRANLDAMERDHAAEWLPWHSPFWSTFTPPTSLDYPPLSRIGVMKATSTNDKPIEIPALLRLITNKNLLINAAGSQKAEALEALQSIMLRFLVTIPPDKVKFILIDPMGLGSNMAGFMHLPEKLVGGKIWTEPQQIEKALADLSVHMEMVIQKYLRNDYPSMEDYNQKAGEVEEPYRLLVIANFPMNFSENAAQRLISIAGNGPRTGVYVLLTRDTELKLPYNFNVEELERLATVIDYDGRFVWRDDDFQQHYLTLDQLPEVEKFKGFLTAVGKAAENVGPVKVPFDNAVKDLTEWWSPRMQVEEGLKVPIGREGARELRDFVLDDSKVHVLVAGKTGFGKSNLLHVIILSLVLHYSPDDLELYLIDFKEGVEFKCYAAQRLPHARVIAIQTEREFGLSVLQGLAKELEDRSIPFKEAGVQGLKNFREKKPEVRMPRIVLMVDEFQEFFRQDDALSGQAANLLDLLVSKGRSYGIHVILASQTLARTYAITRATFGQMAVRIALQCSEADSRCILGDDNPHAKLLSRQGEAMYNDANGLIEGNKRFQVFFLEDRVRDAYLQDLHRLYQEKYANAPLRQIVFEGNAPGDLDGNLELRALLQSPSWPAQPSRLKAWIGEPIAIKSHTAAGFQRQSRSNLLLVGQNEDTAAAMLVSSLVGLATQCSPQEAEFHVLNLSKSDTRGDACLQELPRILPHPMHLYGKRQVEEVIEGLAELLKIREEEAEGHQGKSVFFYVAGIHRASQLRSLDRYTPAEATEKLIHLLTNGPDYGLHLIVWGDTLKNIGRILEQQISEFDLRVALQMAVNDSNQLIEVPDANKLGPYRALFYDEEKTGALEKFRPYALPEMVWLQTVGERLRQRGQQPPAG